MILSIDKQTNQKGFTVVELIITLFILSTAFIAFTGLFVSIKNSNQRAKMASYANTVAFEKLQEYENRAYENITAGDPMNNYEVEDFSGDLDLTLKDPKSAKVFVEDVSATLKLVRVHIDYNSGARQRPVDYTTHIQRSGVGR